MSVAWQLEPWHYQLANRSHDTIDVSIAQPLRYCLTYAGEKRKKKKKKKTMTKKNTVEKNIAKTTSPTLTVASRCFPLNEMPLVQDSTPRIEVADDGATATLVMIRDHDCCETNALAHDDYDDAFKQLVDGVLNDMRAAKDSPYADHFWQAADVGDAEGRFEQPIAVWCLPRERPAKAGFAYTIHDLLRYQWRFPLAKVVKENELNVVLSKTPRIEVGDYVNDRPSATLVLIRAYSEDDRRSVKRNYNALYTSTLQHEIADALRLLRADGVWEPDAGALFINAVCYAPSPRERFEEWRFPITAKYQ